MRTSALCLLLALSFLAGCNCGTAGVDALPFACAEDSECQQPDWLCRGGECVPADDGCAAALEVCDDGLENDCDTLTDCDDPDCAGQVCDATGLICVGAACQCPPPGEDGGITDETVCNDGIDNDCDTLKDCQELACDGAPCGADGQRCLAGACECTGNGGVAEPAGEATCGDDFDNDCDGQLDCADPDCRHQGCGPSSVCCFTGTTGCRDLSTQESHCGGCGTACDTKGQGEVCQPTATSAAVSGRCTCDNPGECILGQSCTGGTCRCDTEANCQSGQVCDNGTCRYP